MEKGFEFGRRGKVRQWRVATRMAEARRAGGGPPSAVKL
jgi:hypothetical protein